MKKLSRRQLLIGSTVALGAGALGTAGYAFGIEPHWIRVRRRDLPIARLPEALVGKTLVQISDLHAGSRVDSGFLVRAIERVNSLMPDVVVITGDFVSYAGGWCLDEAARIVEHLQAPPLGVYAVLGNHDYGNAWSETAVADDLAGKLSDAGVRVLRNEVVDVEGLQLAGADDMWSPCFDPDPAMAKMRRDRAGLVLCHNPDAADLDVWGGYSGWILCGHTHGGQCKPPFLPPPILPVRNTRYTRGEFDVGGGRRISISTGLGHLLQVRFNVRPEIGAFSLARG